MCLRPCCDVPRRARFPPRAVRCAHPTHPANSYPGFRWPGGWRHRRAAVVDHCRPLQCSIGRSWLAVNLPEVYGPRCNLGATGGRMPEKQSDVMIAVGYEAPGGPEVLRPETVPIPVPRPGEVLVKVAFAGVNRPDVVQRQGNYPPPPGASPIPGLEIAGEVVALGGGVEPVMLGQKICALVSGGGYAEYCLADAQPLPARARWPVATAGSGGGDTRNPVYGLAQSCSSAVGPEGWRNGAGPWRNQRDRDHGNRAGASCSGCQIDRNLRQRREMRPCA